MKKDRLIIALHGKKGSGKDTIANIIKAKYPTFEKVAFADPIKETIIRIFKLKDINEYDEFKRKEFNELNINGRDIVREIGMLMRSYDENQYIKYVDRFIIRNPYTIITDLRFENELKYLQNIKALLIKVKRNLNDNDNHISEKEFNDELFDFIIYNEDLEETTKTIYRILDEL